MKTALYRVLAAIVVVMSVSACQTVKQESAMDWMQRQPMLIDP